MATIIYMPYGRDVTQYLSMIGLLWKDQLSVHTTTIHSVGGNLNILGKMFIWGKKIPVLSGLHPKCANT